MVKTGLILIWIFVCLIDVSGQKVRNNAAIPENEPCLKCHGQAVYTVFSVDAKKHLRQPMSASRVISSKLYQNAIHGSLKCVDCHAEGYSTTPHPAALKFDTIFSCADCHAGKRKFKKFHIDSIMASYDKSVHAKAMGNTFNCWKCHNPHNFVTAKSDSLKLKAAITLANTACLYCHNNAINYKRVSDKTPADLIKGHDFLLHAELHLKNIRCIDCHTVQASDSFTSHKILPVKMSIRECTACHSQRNILTAGMFGSGNGNHGLLNFSNSRIMDYAFIMGANRVITLNIISSILFGFVLLLIFTHMFFLFRYRKLHKNGRSK
jgi:hypothetical protein